MKGKKGFQKGHTLTKGKDNPNWKGGLCKCIDCGKEIGYHTKRCRNCNNLFTKGENNPFFGKHHSDKTKKIIGKKGKGRKMSQEAKNKIRQALQGSNSYMFGKPKSKKIRRKLSEANKGKHPSEKTKRQMSNAQKGEKGSNWQGGKSFEKYGQDWTDDLIDSIRKRDNYICQECGVHQDELKRKLDVHHIDYDKKNLTPKNLISLCRSCHMKTNYNRNYWIMYFQNYE